MLQFRAVGKAVPEAGSRTWILQCVLWLSASFEQVAGCLLSCLSFPEIHQLSYYCPESASGYKRSEPPSASHPGFML